MFKGSLTTRRQRFHAWRDSLFSDHAIFRLFWTNLAPVIPGKVWRANHPTPARLRQYATQLGLKTVINLRGKRECGSDALGRKQSAQLNLPYLDMAFESRNAPHKERIFRFHKIYCTLKQENAFPLLLHCKSGADRAGLGSGLVIMFEGGTPQQALRHLHWRHLHFRRSRTGVLDAFFLQYLQYCRELHAPNPGERASHFLNWVENVYDEEALRTAFRAGGISAVVKGRLPSQE